ncbi:MAG: GFA family protein [SAR324 cluster bacterium]|nr:GFA family protein [SAR324 cluster bacterium]
MSEVITKGSCLCGEVQYEIQGPLKMFQYCHCSRCRKFTGSAHASNVFVPPNQFKWTEGDNSIGRYEMPDAKYFATCFCKKCGSSLPWTVQGGKNIVVPAGTLDDDPQLRPVHNAFWESRAPWHVETSELPKFAELPKKN